MKWSTSLFINVISFDYVFCASWMKYFVPIWSTMAIGGMIVWKKYLEVFLDIYGTSPYVPHVAYWPLWCCIVSWVGFLGYLWISSQQGLSFFLCHVLGGLYQQLKMCYVRFGSWSILVRTTLSDFNWKNVFEPTSYVLHVSSTRFFDVDLDWCAPMSKLLWITLEDVLDFFLLLFNLKIGPHYALVYDLLNSFFIFFLANLI